MPSDHSVRSLPSHLRMGPAKLWDHLEAGFEEDADWLRGLRLEGEEEAVDRSSPKEFVDETRVKTKRKKKKAADLSNPSIGKEDTRVTIKHPLLVPFRRTDDAEELRSHFEQARAAIPELRALFKVRYATPEFLLQWGAFQHRCGFVAAAYFSRGDDLGPIRSKRGAQAKSKSLQHKWVAHLLLRQIELGRDRQPAERDVAKAIRGFIAIGKFPADFSSKWFLDILGQDKQLKSTYSRKHFSMDEIRALAAEPRADIPPTNIPIPNT
jgi:hypothetical protein